jgi:hypothetical protein
MLFVKSLKRVRKAVILFYVMVLDGDVQREAMLY